MRAIIIGLAAAAAMAAAPAGNAQTYPTKQIRLLVPYPPGGAVDIVARTLSQQLSQDWNAQFVVDNRPGAGGVIATEIVAKAPADGYTLIMVATGHALNHYFYKTLPYDTFKDFTAITEVGNAPNILLAANNFPIKTVGDLITMAREKPGQISYGTAGTGTSPHLAGELFAYMAKVKIVPVPYKGGAPALADLVAWQIPITFNNIPESFGQIKGGLVRPIAVTTAARSPVLPDVPTVAESGIPGYDTGVWWGVIGPAGLPAAVTAKLHDGFVAAVHTPSVAQHLTQLGAIPIGNTPAEFEQVIRAESDKWAPIMKAAGIEPQ